MPPQMSAQTVKEEAKDKQAHELTLLLQHFKVEDALASLREYGVACVDDLRELEPSELNDFAVTPISKKKLFKLMLHLAVPSFLQVLTMFSVCVCVCVCVLVFVYA